ncbi:Protein of unknown function [Roseateles sp. YR242]|uniref:DUF707 domain-containing protein n=1 Tax=Roseateles sp. YR242 TaxID=1855305 RepID=UPI0008ACC74B|nr:DUF707 domain-containing protein [Roseateles sp. YR242]SEL32944.1 Protein of unknown function [Roseateles sp. YR242]
MTRALPLPESPRRNLVILRAGDQSLHPQWVASADRNFDLLVSYYGQTPDKHRATCDLYETRRGPKWPCLGELLDEHPELVERYDAIWLPDDDLAVDTETLSRMFDLFHAYRLQLAQPALTRNSYYTFDTLLQQSGFVLRHVGFVEVMAPLFSREAMRVCRETFHHSRIGWGLDFVWPGLINNSDRRSIAVLDATPVHHTRPIRGGDLYKNNPGADPREDERRVLASYGRQASRFSAKYEFFGAVTEVRPSLMARLKLGLRQLNAHRRWRRRLRQLEDHSI